MTPSSYQQAVIDAVLNSTDNLMIQAVAGSGKTMTLRMVCEAVSVAFPTLSVAALAFNKKIATTLQLKLPPNVKASTMHSMGNTILRENWSGYRGMSDQTKTDRVIEARFGPRYKRPDPLKRYITKLTDLISKVRNTCTNPE